MRVGLTGAGHRAQLVPTGALLNKEVEGVSWAVRPAERVQASPSRYRIRDISDGRTLVPVSGARGPGSSQPFRAGAAYRPPSLRSARARRARRGG